MHAFMHGRVNPFLDMDLATKAALQGIFGSYGKLLEIRACKNVRMRGQAHVVFEKRECADKALKVHGFPLFGQPLVRNNK